MPAPSYNKDKTLNLFETAPSFMRFPVIAVISVVFSTFGAIHSSSSTDNRVRNSSVVIGKCANPSFENEFRDSKAVFAGKITAETKNGDTRTFEFEVEKYWKGLVGKQIKVNVYETMRYQAWLKVGETYLIFAAGDEDGELGINRCSHSKVFDEADDDLRKLGAAKRPK